MTDFQYDDYIQDDDTSRENRTYKSRREMQKKKRPDHFKKRAPVRRGIKQRRTRRMMW